MSKELEQLEKIASFKVDKVYDIKFENGDSKHYEYETIRDLFPNEFIEIETALKRLNYIDENKIYCISENYLQDIKKIKALEIIKDKEDKKLLFWILENFANYEDYLKHCKAGHFKPYISQEEYNLLKETLL